MIDPCQASLGRVHRLAVDLHLRHECWLAAVDFWRKVVTFVVHVVVATRAHDRHDVVHVHPDRSSPRHVGEPVGLQQHGRVAIPVGKVDRDDADVARRVESGHVDLERVGLVGTYDAIAAVQVPQPEGVVRRLRL